MNGNDSRPTGTSILMGPKMNTIKFYTNLMMVANGISNVHILIYALHQQK